MLVRLMFLATELKKAQALRYSVFYKEKKAKPTFQKKMMRLLKLTIKRSPLGQKLKVI